MEKASKNEFFAPFNHETNLDKLSLSKKIKPQADPKPPSKYKVTITNVVLGDPHINFDLAFTPSLEGTYPGNTAIHNMQIEVYLQTPQDEDWILYKTISKSSTLDELNPDSPLVGNPMNMNLIPFRNQSLDAPLGHSDEGDLIAIKLALSGGEIVFYGEGTLYNVFYATVPYQG